ncbi:hypothetical protein BC628DRAFT_1415987 [Trametes gibbosa]|nr:hypothetical protein BC628DRAFT_1415987 [Trametes gibbosa]
MDPFPVCDSQLVGHGQTSLTSLQIGTRVFFLEGGKSRTGTVQGTETIEGLRFVIIKLDDGSPRPVKLPLSSVNSVSKAN